MGRHDIDQVGILEGFAKLDVHRAERTGIPEAIFAEGKTNKQVVEALRRMAEHAGSALATRVSEPCAAAIKSGLRKRYQIEHHALGKAVVVKKKGMRPGALVGRIAILAAGTSDIPVAEEARVTAEVMRCEVLTHYDVGIAGIHRLLGPVKEILEKNVSVIVVVAGMEGALPSVVRGLVSVPVIGVPTSTGYGYGGHGQAALMTMLQSCAPGLTVVNIDNGFGAGATAALIANRFAIARDLKS